MSDAKRFLRKPTEITAVQWTGDNLEEVEKFTNNIVNHPNLQYHAGTLHLYAVANRSWLPLKIGEWIAKDFIGYYPIKDEAMMKNYEQLWP